MNLGHAPLAPLHFKMCSFVHNLKSVQLKKSFPCYIVTWKEKYTFVFLSFQTDLFDVWVMHGFPNAFLMLIEKTLRQKNHTNFWPRNDLSLLRGLNSGRLIHERNRIQLNLSGSYLWRVFKYAFLNYGLHT